MKLTSEHRILRLTRYLAANRVRDGVAKSAIVDFRKLRLGKGEAIRIGENSIVRGNLITEKEGAVISIGTRSYIGASTIVAASHVTIGDDVLVSWGVTVVDHDSHAIAFADRANDVLHWYNGKKDWTGVKMAPIKICDKSWIGFGATILKGVTVGEGAVVASCAVVTRDVNPWTLVAGNPAKPIRNLLTESHVNRDEVS